jgi:AraC family transcriptional regulator
MDTHETYRHRILKVQLHIQENLDDELSLEKLARIAHFSPFHFHRVFKAIVGEGVNEYVRRLRLEAAAVELKTTDRPVTQIAFAAGYQAHEAFSRAFRQMFGVSPTQFRAGQRDPVPYEENTMVPTASVPPREVRVTQAAPRRVAFLRHVGPYQNVGPLFDQLFALAGPKGWVRPPFEVLGVCWDDPEITAPDKLRYDACLTVPDVAQADDKLGIQTIEGGDYAVLTHRGSYATLGDSYKWLYGVWLPSSGREPRNAPPFEAYLNSCKDVAEENLLTEIHLPLAEK